MAFLTHAPIDLAPLVVQVSTDAFGAVTTFTGVVRNHHAGRVVDRLEYSAYDAMAEEECARIVAETEARWPVRVALQHRIGALAIGDLAVAIAVGSGHRAAAFEACRYLIETVKVRVPIWKKEFYADGSVEWVDPTRSPALSQAGDVA